MIFSFLFLCLACSISLISTSDYLLSLNESNLSRDERTSTLDLLYLLPDGADVDVFNMNEKYTFSKGYKHGWILPSETDLKLYLYLFYDGSDEGLFYPFIKSAVSKYSPKDDAMENSTLMDSSRHLSSSSSNNVVAPHNRQSLGSTIPTLYAVFTTDDDCNEAQTASNQPIEIVDVIASNMVKAKVEKVRLTYSSKPYYVCLQQFETDTNIHDKTRVFSHQGHDYFNSIITSRELMPTWARVILFVLLLTLSGLFSGLNLGLMSLDLSELEILKKIGKPNEQSYAAKIYPLRKRGNFLLCTILLGNVLVNSTSTLILGDMLSGIYAAFGSTLLIVIFGEIIPQAACSKHGLAVGAYTRYIMYLFMFLTSPLSFPLSKLLDLILGKEITAPYSREKIRELMKNVEDLGEKELQIISGALDFNKKTVREIMTPLTDVFMLEKNSRLDFETIAKISQEGYSRIPVYEDTRENVVGLLHVKDFTLLDPDDNMPVSAILEFYNHRCFPCDAEATIDELFELFRTGQTHLAFVNELIQNQDKDPYYLCIGIITLEDILEALVQMEIYDEFDDKKELEKEKLVIKEETEEMKSSRESNLNRLEKNKTTSGSAEDVKRQESTSKLESALNNHNRETSFITQVSKDTTESKASNKLVPAPYESQTSHDLSFFLQQNSTQRALISPQIRFVMFQFLFTTVKPMTSEFLTKNVLELIFRKAEIKESRCLEHRTKAEYLYEYGKGCNYFILILSGEATIEVGKEKLEFPAGPFAYFGVNALLCGCDTVDQVIQDDLNPIVPPPPAAQGAAPSPSISVKLNHETKLHSSKQYIPDFSLRVDDRCVYLKVDRDLWRSGVIKSRYERLHNQVSETIDIVSSDRRSNQSESGLKADDSVPSAAILQPQPQPKPKVLNSDNIANMRRSTVAASAFDKITQVNKAKMQQQSYLQPQLPQQPQSSPSPSPSLVKDEEHTSEKTALLMPTDSNVAKFQLSSPSLSSALKDESSEDTNNLENKPFIPKSTE